MDMITSIKDIEELIENSIEESTTLEYKRTIDVSNKQWKKELAKDVSAMANANGGVIIYGVKEFDDEDKRHLPEEITPLNTTDISKETITQVIHSNISPHIPNIEVSTYIVDSSVPNLVVYVISIPKGSTAHQHTKEKKYYKRYGTTVEAMEDYEIRDIMNRNIHPDVTLEFEIRQVAIQRLFWIQPTYNPLQQMYQSVAMPQIHQQFVKVLNCKPINKGNVIAENVYCFIRVPIDIILNSNDFDIVETENGFVTYRRENLFCDVLEGSTALNVKYGNPRIVPILPNMTGVHKGIPILPNARLNRDLEITWKLYADCAPMKTGSIKLKDIPQL